MPPIPTAAARELALKFDRLLGLTAPRDFEAWSGDVGQHFSISSSSPAKGRLLVGILRTCRCERCLELGAAYGLSAMFMLESQRALGRKIHLTIVEGHPPTYEIVKEILERRYQNHGDCRLGLAKGVLPQLVRDIPKIDFLFHDAEHSQKDYIDDYQSVVTNLSPGALIVFDDLRWEDPRFYKGAANTYKGWRTIVAHDRVRQAVEVFNGSVGVALIE